MDVGDIYRADLNEERLRSVIVLSASKFSSLSGRAIVVPELGGPPDEVPDPWRIEIDGTVYAVDHVRSISADRLLDHVGRAPTGAVNDLRRALRALT
jgi:mRNA-degrading endonuclease toxin of MazEF toxin-antitoxin module